MRQRKRDVLPYDVKLISKAIPRGPMLPSSAVIAAVKAHTGKVGVYAHGWGAWAGTGAAIMSRDRVLKWLEPPKNNIYYGLTKQSGMLLVGASVTFISAKNFKSLIAIEP